MFTISKDTMHLNTSIYKDDKNLKYMYMYLIYMNKENDYHPLPTKNFFILCMIEPKGGILSGQDKVRFHKNLIS